MRIALVTDSHLSPAAPAFNENWRALQRYLRGEGADLTVHLGDITVDGAGDPTQLEFAQALSADWPSPLRFIPGNHDIGDNPAGPGVVSKSPFDATRLEAYRRVFGADYWSMDTGSWRVIALNAQLFGTASAAEAEQWQWLGMTLADRGARRIVLLCHKPLFQDTRHDVAPHIRYVPARQRAALLELLDRHELAIVISGHTHQYRDRMVDGVRHVWLPSTAFYLPDEMQARVGEKVIGLGMLDLSGDNPRLHLVCPDGVQRLCLVDHMVYGKDH